MQRNMKKLRAIGGAYDGRWIEVEKNQLTVRIAKKQPMYSLDAEDTIASSVIEYATYNIRILNFSDAPRMEFLVPIEWSTEEAMLHIMTRWEPST